MKLGGQRGKTDIETDVINKYFLPVVCPEVGTPDLVGFGECAPLSLGWDGDQGRLLGRRDTGAG